MFPHNTTVKMTLAQYFCMLLLHIMYAFIQFGAVVGTKTLVCSFICYISAVLVSVFCKRENIVVFYVFASILAAVCYIGILLDSMAYSFVIFLATALLVATYVNCRRNIIFWIASDIALLLTAVAQWDSYGRHCSVVLFVTIFLAYNMANVTICMLVYFLERRMEALEEKTRDALSASESKGAFLANMSHEIRTPLNAISGLNQLILQENISDEVRENAFGIQTASSDLLAIINDVLDFSKIESGKLQIIEMEYDIKDVINDVVNLIYIRTEEHNFEFLVDCDPKLPKRLYGDEVRIKQVIMNLLSNAVKFTNEGYVKLTISYEMQEEDVLLKVEVKDTGIGIQKEALERLFDSFEQVDTKKNRKVQGTGLGLAISKQLVVLMKGNISVSSEYGAGSVFSIAIPQKVVSKEPMIKIIDRGYRVLIYSWINDTKEIYERMFSKLDIPLVFTTSFHTVGEYVAENRITHYIISDACYDKHQEFFSTLGRHAQVIILQNRDSNIRVEEGLKTVYRPFYLITLEAVLNRQQAYGIFSKEDVWDFEYTAPKAKILVVDDNDVNLRVTVGLMRPLKMKITTANSGMKALELLKAEHFDMIFMDHMMPEMDGVETTRLIRNLSENKWDYYDTVPIVALTANAIGGAREMFLNNGFQDFLAKPMELRDLDRVLRRWLPIDYLETKALKPKNSSYTKEKWLSTMDGREPIGYAVAARQKEKHTAGEKSRYHLQQDTVPMQSQVENVNETGQSGWPEQMAGLDLQTAKHYFGEDYALFMEIVDSFYTAAKEKYEVLLKAFKQQDWETYAREAHALKSSSKSIGAVAFSELALQMEMAAKKKDVQLLGKEHEHLLKELKKLIAQLAPYSISGEDEVDENTLPLIRLKELKEIAQQMELLSEQLADTQLPDAVGTRLKEQAKRLEKKRFSRERLQECALQLIEVTGEINEKIARIPQGENVPMKEQERLHEAIRNLQKEIG